jgi:hypothetical protein
VAAWLTARAEWRQRWRSLVVLAVLAGLAGGVTLAAYAGSRRAATSFDRLLESQKTPNLIVELDDAPDDELVRKAARLPGVETATHMALLLVAPADTGLLVGRDTIAATAPFVAGETPDDPFPIVEGRAFDHRRTDEILVNEAMRDRLGAEVGDRFALVSLTPQQAEAVDRGGELPAPAGPRQDVTLVGVTRAAEDVSDAPDPVLFVTPAFYARHAGGIARAELVGLRVDEAHVADVGDRVRTLFGPGARVQPVEDLGARIDDGLAVDVNGLRVFALAAALAGVVVLGQALVRQAEIASAQHPVRRALGMTSRQLVAAGVITAVPVAAGGALLAAVGVLTGGPLAITGLARQAEPDPGPWADPVALAGAVVVSLVVLALAAGAAARAARRRRPDRAETSRRASRAGRLVAGLPPPAGIGVRMALETGRGPSALPSWPAVMGAAVGVAGVVAALSIGAQVDHLLATPRLWGADYDASVVGAADLHSRERDAARIARDPDVEAVALYDSVNVAVHAGDREDEVGTTSTRARLGTIAPVIPDGRAPAAPDEAALGPDALHRLGAGVGDAVAVERDGRPVTLEVVGTFLQPGTDDPVSGMLVTEQGFEGLEGEDDDSGLLVRFAPGADRAAALARLRGLGERVDVTPALDEIPSDVDNLDELGSLPAVLAGFLALLAAVAAVHALVSATRRRRHDLAVLRVLGFVGGQLRSTVRWQAVTIAAVGLLVGVPIGLVVAHRIWSSLARAVGVVDDWGPPWLVVGLAVPAALAVAALLAAPPGRTAARLSPGRVLRAE